MDIGRFTTTIKESVIVQIDPIVIVRCCGFLSLEIPGVLQSLQLSVLLFKTTLEPGDLSLEAVPFLLQLERVHGHHADFRPKGRQHVVERLDLILPHLGHFAVGNEVGLHDLK